MRKYPPIAIHSRECTKAYTMPGSNVTIDKGFIVMIPNQVLQNDPKYFPNPERFDPERFRDDDALHKYKYIYSPFGEGPRQCIGILQINALVESAKIIHKFIWQATGLQWWRRNWRSSHFLESTPCAFVTRQRIRLNTTWSSSCWLPKVEPGSKLKIATVESHSGNYKIKHL